MQAGPPPSGGRSGLQGRVPQRSATVTPEEEEPASGRLHVPTVRGGVHTRPPPPEAGLAAGKAEPQEHPRGSAREGALQAAREPPEPQLHAAPGVHIRWDAAPRQPDMAGGRQGRCCGGLVLGHRRAVRRVGRMIRGAGSRVEGPLPQGLPLHGQRAPQRLPCRHARGGAPPNPPRALVWSHWAQDKPPHEGRGEPETPVAPEAQTRGTWV